ncbi:MAG: hypothetical protein OEL20_08025 [Sulfuritalea sp.]|jgi:uncharacterized membrane protein|nr:hypothetical protein [Sulfuritalea sp.]
MTQPGPAVGALGKAITFVAGAIVLALGFMFSLVVIAVVLVAGAVALAWFWWKTRALRKAMREQAPVWEKTRNDGQVIDGEAVVVEEFTVTRRNILPGEPDKP